MKKLLSFLAAAALAFAPMSVLAADSPTNTGSGIVGTPVGVPEGTELVMTTGNSKDPEVNAKLAEASDQLKAKDAAVVDAIKAAVAAAGLNVNAEDYQVADIFDLSIMDGNVAENFDGSLTVKVQTSIGNTKDFVVLNYHNNTWRNVPATNLGNGVLELNISGLSPFAVITFKSASAGTGTAGGTTSGSVNTAASTNMGWAVAGVAAGLAGVLFLIKARKNLAK